eukprot:TRINITY_DN73999_c0_g1_i1.p1 TRINITY_DN73999_c0_g1~~TRINITY_DN73999_c0_g1_i1.p1  ORF type:complete len:596 (+),score=115.56 TRINITY_DN73999_c0_g1_i1:123-1790(+)
MGGQQRTPSFASMVIFLVVLAAIAGVLPRGTQGVRNSNLESTAKKAALKASSTVESASGLGEGSVLMGKYLLTEQLKTPKDSKYSLASLAGFFNSCLDVRKQVRSFEESDSEESDDDDEETERKREEEAKRKEEKDKQAKQKKRIDDIHARCTPSAEVASGSYGFVYRAFDNETQSKVIVKYLKDPDRESVRELDQECEILQELHRHDDKYPRGSSNVVKCFHNGARDRRHFIIMENGGDQLGTFLDSKRSSFGDHRVDFKAFTAKRSNMLVQLFSQVLDGVAFMAAQGYWHRDLKPKNIVVHEDDNNNAIVKIVDLGFAAEKGVLDALLQKVIDGESVDGLKGQDDAILTKNFETAKWSGGEIKVKYTYPYAPPEVRRFARSKGLYNMRNRSIRQEAFGALAKGLPTVEAFDLWSVGMSFLEMLCQQGFSKVKVFANKLDERAHSRDDMFALLKKENCWPHEGTVDNKVLGMILDLLTSTLDRDPAQRKFPSWHQGLRYTPPKRAKTAAAPAFDTHLPGVPMSTPKYYTQTSSPAYYPQKASPQYYPQKASRAN